jgi:hypothetical protein
MTDEPPPATRSEPPAAIEEFHAQDWLIVIEALAAWGGNPNTAGLTDSRKGRAWDLMSTIASEQDVPDENPLQQIDDIWDEPQEDRDR